MRCARSVRVRSWRSRAAPRTASRTARPISIYQDGEEVIDQTDYPEGSSDALLPSERCRTTLPPEFIGHVMIFRTFPRVSYGLVMDAVKPMHIGDFLWDPDHTP